MKQDLSNHGYQMIRQIERHQQEGEVTYQGLALKQDQEVIIKEFSFANSDSNWARFEAYEREVEILKQVQHPRIPGFIDNLETPEGFCLITEYQEGKSLAKKRNFTPEQIKQIAISILEILVYLQKCKPPIIHSNIKPENILVAPHTNGERFPAAYLINFGYARMGIEESLNHDFIGTSGFMPPEQELNGTVTINSDLYSLGVTLVCLLTSTPSTSVRKLIDRNHRLNLKKLTPQLSILFIMWLEKMLSLNSKDRFENAGAALAALKPIPVFGDAANFKNIAMGMQSVRASAILGAVSVAALIALATSLTVFRQQRYQNNFRSTQRPQQERTITRFSGNSSIAKLLGTSECYGCNLHGVNLAALKIEDADLRDADLFKANLRGAELRGARLQNANLQEAQLQGANLIKAKLQEANLSYAHLEGANLTQAVLKNANLQQANLYGANLTSTNLLAADFHNANLRDARLKRADLNGANLNGANLNGANLNGANLRGVDLRRATLKGTSLIRVDLVGANLAGVNLLDAKLEGANLKGANLKNANLLGANLKNVNLQGANLQGAIMPDGSLIEEQKLNQDLRKETRFLQ